MPASIDLSDHRAVRLHETNPVAPREAFRRIEPGPVPQIEEGGQRVAIRID